MDKRKSLCRAQCEAGRSYDDRISQIAARSQAIGINFVGIYTPVNEPLHVIAANAVNEPLHVIAANAVASGYQFPILVDRGGVLAGRLGVGVAPEVWFTF